MLGGVAPNNLSRLLMLPVGLTRTLSNVPLPLFVLLLGEARSFASVGVAQRSVSLVALVLVFFFIISVGVENRRVSPS